jgi:hypothetical protein
MNHLRSPDHYAAATVPAGAKKEVDIFVVRRMKHRVETACTVVRLAPHQPAGRRRVRRFTNLS